MTDAEGAPEPSALTALKQAIALHRAGRLNDAIVGYGRALELRPGYPAAFNNRAAARRKLGDLEGAVADYDSAIASAPNYVVAHANRANLLVDLGRFREAVEGAMRAKVLAPDRPGAAHETIARARLMQGDWLKAWPYWDQWRARHHLRIPPEKVLRSLDGIAGKRVLIYAELGLGDTILFSRYALALRDAGAVVTLGLQSCLLRLMTPSFPGVRVVDRATISADVPTDYFCALPSLPAVFGTSPETVPEGARIRAEPGRVGAWASRIGPRGFKIGICWQGATLAGDDIGRSFPVALFEGISRLPGVRLISLHKGEGEAQLAALPAGMAVETLGDFDAPPNAFLDTAAVMEVCDLVITSDTSIAHLAGALGVPTWLALKRAPAFLWLMERADSPWYPNLRLFRQRAPEDWPGVFRMLEEDLRAMLARRP